MGTSEMATLKRIGRAAVAVAIEEGLRYTTGTSGAVIAIPLILGLGKFLRARFGLSWLPF